MPYPPFNYEQYRTARQRARRGLGPEPMDSVETDAEVRARYDARYGEGAYDADAPGRAYRQGPNAPAWARPSGAPAPQQPLPPGYSDFAAGMAEAETGKTRAERLADADATDARWDRMKADYDRATGYTPVVASIPAEEDQYPGAGRPGYERSFTPKEVIGQREGMTSAATGGTPLAFTVPSPRMPYGGDVRPGEPIYDEDAAAAYTQRALDPRTMRAAPSKRDLAMRARGMTPVYNADGSVGYSIEAYPEDNPQTAVNEGAPFPGGVGRAGRRQDLIDKGWEVREVDGPTGKQTVYRPGATAQLRYDAQADARTASRLKRSAGISSAEAGALPLAEGETSPLTALRQKARNARDDDYNARNARWKAQAMLAGGQPTGGPRGTKAATNALLMMNDPALSEDQRRSLRYMLPGGQLSAAVDAQNMQNANDVIKRFMTSGAAAGLNNPLAAAQAQMAQQQADAAKPVQLRAQEQVAAGRINHPDVLQHADDIVNTHYSSRPGMLGVSTRFTDNEVMLAAQRLADDTGMPIAEAEKVMRRIQADRNRNSVASSIVAPFYDQ